jgi:hypothetical protein
MAKKLLSEAQVRRFAKLASLSPVNEMYDKRDDEENMEEGSYMKRDDEEVMQEEDATEEMAADAAEAGMDELPAPEEEEMEMGGEESDVELSQDMVDAIAAALPALQMIADASGEEMEMGAEEPAEMEMDAEEPAEMEMDAEEDEVMEALEGINYVPETADIVQEVARRVAKRLLKAKKAEKNLQEALGNKTKK